jgi:hypothetical protein
MKHTKLTKTRMTTFKQRFLSFSSIFVFLCSSLLLSLSGITYAQTLLAGNVAGQFSVNQNGAATYTLLIQVPPGVTGMQPQLSLNYNSQDGHGLAGVGWSLGGLSVITRCEQTLAQEGGRGVVNLDDNDRYCLEGQKLMAVVPDTYAQDGAEYRTENDKFSKIISYGRSGNGSTWFKVWTKSGQIMEFGNTLDSRVIGSGYTTARQWSLNRVTDVNGNTMTVSYLNSPDRTTHLPEVISYGGNTTTGTVANRSVQIVYVARPDITNSYIGNQKLVESSRISKITTAIGTVSVKNYNLSYEISPSTKRSRLIKVDECDGLGTSCLKPVEFAYNNADVSVVNKTTVGHGVADVARKKLVDLFGDGRPVYYTNNSLGQHYASRINADGTVQNWTWTGYAVYSGNSEIVDLFGDGRPVFWTHDTAGNHWATRFNPDQTVQMFSWNGGHGIGSSGEKLVIDIFGDGKPVYYTRSGDSHYATRFNPISNSLQNWSWTNVGLPDSNCEGSAFHDLFGDGKQMFWRRCGAWRNDHTAVRFKADSTFTTHTWSLGNNVAIIQNIHAGGSPIDAYGDGLPVIWSRTGTYSNTHVITQLNKDGTHLTRTFPNFEDGAVSDWTFADIFGDGHKVYWQLAGSTHRAVRMNKDGTYQQWSWSGYGKGTNEWRLADLFGDGRQVFWTRSGSTHEVNRLNQDGTIESYTYSGHNTGTNGWDMGDLYGDGRQVYWTQSGTNHYTTSFSRGDFDNLKTVTGSTGLKQEPIYASINQPVVPPIYTSDRATPSAAVFPQKDIQFPMRVVKQVATDTGLGGTNTTTYTYGGLKSDQTTGRGFLGFRWMGSKDLSTNIETMSVFHQTWPFVGMLKTSETRLTGSGNGGLLKRSTVTPGCKIPQTQAACAVFPTVNAPGTLYFPYTSQSMDETWDLNGAALPVVTTAYQYNLTAGDTQLYGNPTQIASTTTSGLVNKTVTTENEYFSANTASWVLGRLKKSTVASTTTDTNIATGNPTVALPTITVTRLNGLPMKYPGLTGSTWSTTNANSVSLVCTSTGSGYTTSQLFLGLSGSTTMPTSASWLGNTSICTWTATGQGGSATAVETLTTINAPPIVSVAWNTMPLVSGQQYTRTTNTANATSLLRSCTASGSGFVDTNTSMALNTTITDTPLAAWIGYPSTCVWTATGPGGTTTLSTLITTIAPITPPRLPVYRVRYDLRYFYTTSITERDWHINNWGGVNEGIAFYVYGTSTAIPGLLPVRKYLNTTNSAYFYTNNPTEIANMGNYPQFSSRGIVWYAQFNSSSNGAVPLYRYRWYDTNNLMYFYTRTLNGGGSYNIPDGNSQYVWTTP